MALSGDYRFVAVIPYEGNQNARGLGGDITAPGDQHLVVAARSGCRTAFNELWDLYSRRV